MIISAACARLLIVAGLSAVTLDSAAAQSAGQWKSSQDLYAKVCGYCHSAGVGPVLDGRHLHADYIAAVVRNGQFAMPAFRQTDFSDAELAALAKVISESAPSSQPPVAGGH